MSKYHEDKWRHLLYRSLDFKLNQDEEKQLQEALKTVHFSVI